MCKKAKAYFFRQSLSPTLRNTSCSCFDIYFQHPKQAKVSRRFLVVEGIYMNTGKICNIEPMVELKRKYKLRFFIDETVSFGTLGEHGKGITEYKNIAVSARKSSSKMHKRQEMLYSFIQFPRSVSVLKICVCATSTISEFLELN